MVSILTLEVIAVERFISLVFPMKKQPIRSNKVCFIVTILTWLLVAVCRSSHFYARKLIHKGTTPYCVHNWQPAFDHAEAVKLEFTIILVAFSVIPFLLLTSLYSAIIISLHRQKRNLHLASEATKRRAKKYTDNLHVGNSGCRLPCHVATTQHLRIPECVRVVISPTV